MAGGGDGGTHTFTDPLHGAHFGAILYAVEGEVDLGWRLLLLYGANGIVDLDVANILRARRASAVGIHDGRRGAEIQVRGGRREVRDEAEVGSITRYV